MKHYPECYEMEAHELYRTQEILRTIKMRLGGLVQGTDQAVSSVAVSVFQDVEEVENILRVLR